MILTLARMAQIKSTRAFRTISEAGDELDLQPHVLRFWESKFPQIQPMKRSGGRRFYRPEDIEFLRGIKILLHREKHPIKDVQKLIRIRGHQSVVELGRSIERASRPKDIKETNLVPKRIKPVINVQKPEPVETIQEPLVEPEPIVVEPVRVDDEIVRRVDDNDIVRPIDDDGDIVRRVVPFNQPPAESHVEPIAEFSSNDEDMDDMRIPEIDPGRESIIEPEPSPEPIVEPVIEERAEDSVTAGISEAEKEDLETALSKLKSLRSRWDKFKT